MLKTASIAVLAVGAASCGPQLPELINRSPAAPIVQVADLGVIRTSSRVNARDGSYTGVFGGHVVWLFGDTFLSAPDAQGRGLISNSWSFTDDFNAANGISGFHERRDVAGAPTMLLRETPAESTYDAEHSGSPCRLQPCGARWAIWPEAMVSDSARARALVFYQVDGARPGESGFHAFGYSVAVWNDFAKYPVRPADHAGESHSQLLFQEEDPPFGSAALVRNDTLFAYACTYGGLIKPCMLGKVSLADVLDRSRWTFYARGGAWSSAIANAVPVFNGNAIMSVGWNEYLERYVAVYSRPLSLDVELRTAPTPEGPWSAPTIAFTARAAKGQTGGVYDAVSHPEYDGDGGRRIYVTYSRSTGEFASELRLVEIRLSTAVTR